MLKSLALKRKTRRAGQGGEDTEIWRIVITKISSVACVYICVYVCFVNYSSCFASLPRASGALLSLGVSVALPLSLFFSLHRSAFFCSLFNNSFAAPARLSLSSLRPPGASSGGVQAWARWGFSFDGNARHHQSSPAQPDSVTEDTWDVLVCWV